MNTTATGSMMISKHVDQEPPKLLSSKALTSQRKQFRWRAAFASEICSEYNSRPHCHESEMLLIGEHCTLQSQFVTRKYRNIVEHSCKSPVNEEFQGRVYLLFNLISRAVPSTMSISTQRCSLLVMFCKHSWDPSLYWAVCSCHTGRSNRIE